MKTRIELHACVHLFFLNVIYLRFGRCVLQATRTTAHGSAGQVETFGATLGVPGLAQGAVFGRQLIGRGTGRRVGGGVFGGERRVVTVAADGRV